MEKIELKKKATKLRKQGLSYKEILKIISVSKSTLSLWLRDISLTETQKKKLKNKVDANRKKFAKWNKKEWEDNREEALKRVKNAGRKCQELYGDKIKKNLWHPNDAANLAYRKDELPVKYILDKIYNTCFQKEKIKKYFYDFTDDKYIIEHTLDHTKGLSEAIERLSLVPEKDNRKKILITKEERVGPKRRGRCDKSNIVIIDTLSIETGRDVQR